MRFLLPVFLLLSAGCGKQHERPEPFISGRHELLLENTALMNPQPFVESRLFSSSSGPVSLTGYSIEKYGDLDHGSFLAVRDIPGGVEAVLAEVKGAGAVTWVWSANPIGELTVEIDGHTVSDSFKRFLSGKTLAVKEPFAAKTALGWNLHYPLIHQEYCRIALKADSRETLGALFYKIAWNRLADTGFSNGGNTMSKPDVQWPSETAHLLSPSWSGVLKANESTAVISEEGSGTIQCIEIIGDSRRELKDVSVELFWDGDTESSLSCPLHLLCGVSDEFENVEAIPVSVKKSTISIRWPMPFRNGARIEFKNGGVEDACLNVQVSINRESVSDERFRGAYSSYKNLQTDLPNLLTLAEVQGRGRFVGCILSVNNKSNGWWGEGDCLIRLDHADAPAWRGTGTEDYFGFAWCSKSRFLHPLRGQPSTGTLYRYHLLDTLPFYQWGRFDFEAHGIAPGLMDYSALVLWYSDTDSMNDSILLK